MYPKHPRKAPGTPSGKATPVIKSKRNAARKKDMNTDESSDNEPLKKIAKTIPKAAKKTFSVPPQKSVDSEKEESLDDEDGSDDEPLSERAKKLYPKRQRKAPGTPSGKATPVIKSKRNAARKEVKYAESSSDISDDEPLATIKKKVTKAPKEKKTSDNSKETQLKDKSLKDSSSSDSNSDDSYVPLVNANAKKKKPVKKNTKRTTASPGRASRKRRGHSDESSDDEPLVRLVKKNRTGKQTKNQPKASPPKKKKNTTSKKSRKMLESESSGNSSDDEPLIKAAKHPQVTKILRIILERCDGEEAGDTGTGGLTKATSAETQIAGKSEESEDSAKSEEE
ncbi:uncharacterized protein LOC144529159 [Sander vitreus]